MTTQPELGLFGPPKPDKARHIARRMIAALKMHGGWMTRKQFAERGIDNRQCRAGREASHGRILCGQRGFKLRLFATCDEIRECMAFFQAIEDKARLQRLQYARRSHKSLHERETR
jgi:hypothetical protein